MTDLVQNAPVAQHRSPLEIGVDRIWRFFCSVRAAIYEVSILAVLVLIGTLRGSEVPQWIANLVPPLQGFVDRWYDWDVFKSLPFAFMLGLLAIAITICTINRCPGIWASIANPTVPTTHGFLRSAEIQLHGESTAPKSELVSDLTTNLRNRRYRVLTQEVGDETHIYADRYRYGKLGTFPFHLALILILIGGIVGSRYGFREDKFVIPEGSTMPVGHGTGLSLLLEDFQDSYTEEGQAREYRSDLVLYENGEEVKRQSITVNNPMTYNSTIIYQSSFGPSVEMIVTNGAGDIVFAGPIPLGVDYSAKENPDAPAAVEDLIPVSQRMYVITPDSNPFNAPELDKLKLRSGQVYVQFESLHATGGQGPVSAVINQGVPTSIGDLTVTFVREGQWSLLQVARNPGIPIFWAAAFLMIGGLGIVFYFPHRRIRAIVSSKGGNSVATMAPMARRDWSARRSFEVTATGIVSQFGDSWRLTERTNALQSPAHPAGMAGS